MLPPPVSPQVSLQALGEATPARSGDRSRICCGGTVPGQQFVDAVDLVVGEPHHRNAKRSPCPGSFFGTSGEFWLNLQKLYELRQAEEKMGAAITRLASPDDGYRPSARG